VDNLKKKGRFVFFPPYYNEPEEKKEGGEDYIIT